MRNGRCHKHGGASTGPRTAEGLERSRRATWKHGGRSAEARAAARERAEARRLASRLLGRLRLLWRWPDRKPNPDKVLPGQPGGALHF